MPGYLTRQFTLRSDDTAKPLAAAVLRRAHDECEVPIAHLARSNDPAFPRTLPRRGCSVSVQRRRFDESDRTPFRDHLSNYPQ